MRLAVAVAVPRSPALPRAAVGGPTSCAPPRGFAPTPRCSLQRCKHRAPTIARAAPGEPLAQAVAEALQHAEAAGDDGEEVAASACDNSNLLAVLAKSGIKATIVDLDEAGEEVCELSNFTEAKEE